MNKISPLSAIYKIAVFLKKDVYEDVDSDNHLFFIQVLFSKNLQNETRILAVSRTYQKYLFYILRITSYRKSIRLMSKFL